MSPPGETSVISAQRRARTSPMRRVSTVMPGLSFEPVADDGFPEADEIAQADDQRLAGDGRNEALHQRRGSAPFEPGEGRARRAGPAADLPQGRPGRRSRQKDRRELAKEPGGGGPDPLKRPVAAVLAKAEEPDEGPSVARHRFQDLAEGDRRGFGVVPG